MFQHQVAAEGSKIVLFSPTIKCIDTEVLTDTYYFHRHHRVLVHEDDLSVSWWLSLAPPRYGLDIIILTYVSTCIPHLHQNRLAEFFSVNDLHSHCFSCGAMNPQSNQSYFIQHKLSPPPASQHVRPTHKQIANLTSLSFSQSPLQKVGPYSFRSWPTVLRHTYSN